MSERSKQRWESAWLWAFPLALWLVSTGALFHWDLGKYSDDWAVSLRVPETDAYAWPGSPWERWNYFWRPLHLIAVYGLGTAFWHHDWVNHLISALAHLGVAALLWRLLRTLGASRAGTSAAVCVFVTFPISYEAVLWPAALGSVVSVGWFLLIALMCARLARIERVLTRGEAARWFAALAGMSFLCASWHEQGAACVAAIPLLMMAVRGTGPSLRVSMRRAVLATGASVAGCLVYIALLMGTAPRGKRGSAGSLVEFGDAGARAGGFGTQVSDWLVGHKFVDGVVRPAAGVLGESVGSPVGLAALGVLLVSGAAWWWTVVRSRDETDTPLSAARERGPSSRWWWLAAFALGVMIFGLAPVLAVRGNFVFSRYFYHFGMGLGVLVGALWMGVLSGSGAWARWTRVAGATAVVCLCIASAAAMVHAQAAFMQRSRADERLGAELRRLMPRPAQGTVFVPVDLRDRGNFVSRGFPQGRVLSALAHPWSSWAFMQRIYGRSDISATHWRPGVRSPVTIDERGVTYPRGVADWKGRIAEAPSFVPRERVVVFTVDEQGRVRLLEWDEARRMAGGGPDRAE